MYHCDCVRTGRAGREEQHCEHSKRRLSFGSVLNLRGSSRINLDCRFLNWITVLTGQTLKLDTSGWGLVPRETPAAIFQNSILSYIAFICARIANNIHVGWRDVLRGSGSVDELVLGGQVGAVCFVLLVAELQPPSDQHRLFPLHVLPHHDVVRLADPPDPPNNQPASRYIHTRRNPLRSLVHSPGGSGSCPPHFIAPTMATANVVTKERGCVYQG
eukprot:1176346-Prorocentrum_minimum.AAC.1